MLLQEPSPDIGAQVAEGAPLAVPVEVPVPPQPLDPVEEGLVNVTEVPVFDAYARLGILESRYMRVRADVARRLMRAHRALPRGFGLTILDAHRAPRVQEVLLEYYAEFGPTDGYVASLDPHGMRAPHTTGGAVDLTLTWHDVPLALGTDYDSFADAAHVRAFEADDGPVRRLRRLLASVMLSEGFAPYAFEWWHWSFGDDVWAAQNGRPARYDSLVEEDE